MTHTAGTTGSPPAIGHWTPGGAAPSDAPDAFKAAIGELRAPVFVLRTDSGFAVAAGGSVALGWLIAPSHVDPIQTIPLNGVVVKYEPSSPVVSVASAR